MPRAPSEHAVWLGCTGMVLVVLESMLKLVITSKCAISGFRVYLPSPFRIKGNSPMKQSRERQK